MTKATHTGRTAPRPTRKSTEPVDRPVTNGPSAGQPARLKPRWLAGGVVAVLVASVCGLAFGPVRLPPDRVAVELLNLIPGVDLHSGLSDREAAIVTVLRLPRVVLGLLVGAMLSLAGGCYQGVFRNPLADPYLLGVAAGAGLGATATIALRSVVTGDETTNLPVGVPVAAFAGALAAVALTYALGSAKRAVPDTTTLILAGVAVSSFLLAMQTYLLQRNVQTIREVYSWILGRVATAGWHDVLLVLPYAVITAVVVIAHGRELDVLSLGDDEAASLGLHPRRSRYLLLALASLGTAAAVAVSGLIGFVGLVVPHVVRLLAGTSYRSILPLSMLFGGAFLVFADLIARTVAAPAEIPLGVVTAFFGAPFFVIVLRTSREAAT